VIKVPPGVKFSATVVYPVVGGREIVGFLAHYDAGTYRKGYGWHTGVDIIISRADRGRGVPVRCIADGIVIESSPTLSLYGYGNTVLVYHPQFGTYSRYAHLEKRSVKAGDVLRAGATVGTMGKSGTDNVHLHWDVCVLPLPMTRYNPKNHGKPATKEAERLLVVKYFTDPSKWVRARAAA
jgi:murein DD-endopeptidase MepM/ murein hydrolase activator NlpD